MKKGDILILVGIFLFLSAISIISADTGPHPSAHLYFQVTYNNSSIVDNFSARLLACGRECQVDNPNDICIDGCAVDNGALCTDGVCEFFYYRVERVPSTLKLLFNVKGENFSSNTINFSWIKPVFYYDIDINSSSKVIITPSNPFPIPETSNPSDLLLLTSLILALALTIVIEIIVMIIFLRKWKIKTEKWKRPIITLIIADIISVPMVWIIFFVLVISLAPLLSWTSAFFSILIAEICAVIFEAYFIYWFNKRIISLKRLFILSVMMNLASFVIGGIILTALLSVW